MDRTDSAGRFLLICYYHRLNCYSFNALAGAIDRRPVLADLPVVLAFTAEQLRHAIADSLKRCNRIVLALSIMTSQFGEIRGLLRQIRTRYGSQIIIVAGGPHPTACADEVLEAGVDIVCCGEAEVSFPDVLECLLQGKDFRHLAGISFLKDAEVVTQPRAHPVDLNSLSSFSPKRGMIGPIEITRGCPFACSYCQTAHIFGVHLRHRSIDNIARHAADLRKVNGKVVRILSPNAFSYGSPDGRQLNLRALHDLLAALRKTVSASGRIIFAHFPSEVRPEHVTPETLGLLKEFADNDEIVVGAQSGSQRMLDLCHRSHTVEDVLTAVSLARKYGYKTIVDFIFGLPDEEETDMKETLAFIDRLVRLGARIHPHIFAPLPQTAFSARHPGHISPPVLQALEELKTMRRVYANRLKMATDPRDSTNK